MAVARFLKTVPKPTAPRRVRVAIGLAALTLLGGSAKAFALPERPQPWRVLILMGGDFYLPGSNAQEQSLRATLTRGARRPVEFRAEALDALSFDLSNYEAELLALLRQKHRGVKLDLVMPMGDAALSFALNHRAELWPGVPMVFFSVSPDLLRDRTLGAGVAGVTIDFDVAGTLDLATRLQPAARRMVVVGGLSEYDRYWVPVLKDAARQHPGLETTFLMDRPFDEILSELAQVPPSAIVLYTSLSRDSAGQPFVPANLVEAISHASAAPAYGFVETYLGRGIVGGSMSSFEAQGRAAAELALRVLSGERPEAIATLPPPPYAVWVDWRELRRRGLAEGLLPAGSVVRFRPPSVWSEYRSYVLGAALILATETGLLAALVVQRRRRQGAEAEAARQRGELAHAARLSVVGELTASIAHEINQPLGAILSYAEAAEILAAERPGQERLQKVLEHIRNEDLRASEVIQRIRTLAHKGPLEQVPIDVNELADEVLGLAAHDANRRGVTLVTDLGPASPRVRGDRVQLQQVMLNLVLNGMEAMIETPAAQRRIVLRTSPASGGVQVEVADNGPGLEASVLQHLFESFFTTKKEGMGLGLSIARSIVEGHGGRITAESGAERGATFRVWLPAMEV